MFERQPAKCKRILQTVAWWVAMTATVSLVACGEGPVAAVVGAMPTGTPEPPVAAIPVIQGLEAALEATEPVLVLAPGERVPIQCQAIVDGSTVPVPALVESLRGTVVGGLCGDLVVTRSGIDTLRIAFGGLETDVPLAVAIPPSVTPALGEDLRADSLPAGVGPWAPSARVNSQGQVEVYFTGYYEAPGQGNGYRGHLHRLVSDDGSQFRYDGVAIQHEPDHCTLTGSGIENINIVPRADGPGWRMFFAAGSFGCYGWQVFSAVSSDERTWTVEPGVRLDNGGTTPPETPVSAPWPVGEGIVTERLESGEWRMIVSGYERRYPREDKFQIVEWRSPDQLEWTYMGPLFSTDDMPREGQASVYSPTIQEIEPGLWRMFFTADNRHDPDGRSGIWSAVSVDKTRWVLEGEVIGAPGVWIRYAALANQRLYYVRRDGNGPRRLTTARVITR